ncbi:MAG: hypothetical protein HYT63_01060 [Candidatus Yanofskybacteria bacterium]|nr:hypothetical protein [Candidatus Yanofskybacteria bacterium]
MRYLSHKELHEVIEVNPELKKRSDEIHSLPKAKNWEEFLEQKLQMLEIYAQAVGCNCVQEVQGRMKEVVEYLKQYENPLVETGKSPTFAQCLEFIRSQEKVWAEERKCHAPNANSYICYCK